LDELNIEPHLLTLLLVQHPPASALNAPHTNTPSSEATGLHINTKLDMMPTVVLWLLFHAGQAQIHDFLAVRAQS
jgi:hypothetical protein